MRRIALLGLLLSLGCTSAEAPSIVAGISFSPPVIVGGVFPGDHVQLSVTPVDANGDPVPTSLAPITYSSSNTSVATIDSTGVITAVAAGSTTLTAAAGGSHAAFTLNVDGNVTGSVVVTPPTADVNVASQIQLADSVVTTLNHPARNKSVTWSTSDATKATVDSTGKVTGVAAATSVSICATATDATSIKGCSAVTVH